MRNAVRAFEVKVKIWDCERCLWVVMSENKAGWFLTYNTSNLVREIGLAWRRISTLSTQQLGRYECDLCVSGMLMMAPEAQRHTNCILWTRFPCNCDAELCQNDVLVFTVLQRWSIFCFEPHALWWPWLSRSEMCYVSHVTQFDVYI